MSYTTEPTIVTNTTIQSSWANTYVRDNIEWLATNAPAVYVRNSANIVTATSSTTTLTYDTEQFDNASLHSTSSNTGRITASDAGKYLVGFQFYFAANATGVRVGLVKFNGTGQYPARAGDSAVSSGDVCVLAATVPHYATVAATNYWECQALQTSGGNLNVTADFASTAAASPVFFAFWLRN